MDRVFGVLEVDELSGTGGARLATGSCEALGYPVVTKRALICNFLGGMNVAASIGACLHAISTSKAVLRVDKHHSVRRDEGGAYWADLGAGRIRAVVAHLRNEEVLFAVFFSNREAFFATIGRDDFWIGHVFVGDVVALDPGAEVAVRNVVFHLAGADAVAASDAFGNINQHSPPVIGHGVVR